LPRSLPAPRKRNQANARENAKDNAKDNTMTALPRRLSGCVCCNGNPATAGVSRRSFLAGGVAALGLGAAAARRPAHAQSTKPRVDVHHHYLAPVQREAFLKRRPGGLPDWSVQKSLDDMDKGGVQTAVVSSVQPGVWFGETEPARKLAREVNDYGAGMVRDHKGRFGLFAAIPLPDPDGSLKEIEYALDTLHADGIGLFTSYKDKYLGDPAFVPVLEELNRRKAVVYFHPNTPECCGALVPGAQPSMLEWPYDTGRAVVSLLLGGALAKYPDIKWIFSHAGGPVPALAGRIVNMTRQRQDLPQIAPQGVMHELTRLHYDTANATSLRRWRRSSNSCR
jgi:predicted TIM-barrel fold metal-dependent hydrolase